MSTSDPAIKTKQFRHQAETYLAHRDDGYYSLFWEMGLGKTKTLLDVASHLHHEKKIDALLILAPNAVYKNWLTQEIPPHLAAPYVGMAYKTKGAKSEKGRLKMLYMLSPDEMPEWNGKLRVVVMSYDSLSKTDLGYEFAKKFSQIYRTMIVADESTAIKSGGTKTAKKAKAVAAYCHFKWIATGTPVAQSPFDLHSQLEFLDPDFWQNHGMRTKESFRTQFGVFELKHVGGGKKVNALVQYRRLDFLNKIIAPISSRLLKEDSEVDLPPKIYTTRMFTLSDPQVTAYESLRDEFMAELESGAMVEAPLAITRLIRLQQICSGFVTAEIEGDDFVPTSNEAMRKIVQDKIDVLRDSNDREERAKEGGYEQWIKNQGSLPLPIDEIKPIVTEKKIVDIIPPEDNPRLKLLLELIEEANHKVIVWTRFTRDVEIICESLGDACVRYDGKTSAKDREIALTRFRDPADPARVFVANVHAISQGVTLTVAKTVIYYTNSHSPEKRLQSEDRAHRIGQDVSVQIIDIAAEGTVDVRLIESLIKKFDVAAQVTGDRYREWISLSPRASDD